MNKKKEIKKLIKILRSCSKKKQDCQNCPNSNECLRFVRSSIALTLEFIYIELFLNENKEKKDTENFYT